MGGRSSSSSASQSNQSSTNTDSRLVIGNDSIGAASGGSVSLSDMRDQSMVINDSRDLSTSFQVNDSSTSSSSTSTSLSNVGNTTNTSVDPGALKAMERALLTVERTNEQAFSFGGDAFGFASDAAKTFTDASLKGQQSVLESIAKADATKEAGFSKLLALGAEMFSTSAKGLERTQNLTADAYRSATAEKAGALDNKTIMVLGALAIGVFGLRLFKKG